LYSLSVDDLWTNARAFPTFISAKELDESGQVRDSDNQPTQGTRSQALFFKMETNPQGSASPFRIDIRSEKTLFIVANFHFIKEIKRSVLSAFKDEKLDFSFYQEAAAEKAIEYMYAGKEFLENIKKGEFKH
jgi:hypothetical protein